MAETAPRINPAAARSAAEYVALLRRVRERSGLSYRKIERRAEAAGETLPPSTLATMLGRNSLPREELAAVFLRACGRGNDEVAEWIEARRRLASPAGAPPPPADAAPADAPPPHPGRAPGDDDLAPTGAPLPHPAETGFAGVGDAHPHPSRRRRLAVLAAVAATAAAAVAGVAVMSLVGDDGAPGHRAETRAAAAPPGNRMPAPGPYRIRAAYSGLCLSEYPDAGDGRLYQAPCAGAIPDMSLETVGRGTHYQIRTDHPHFGPGCTGIRDGAVRAGVALSDGLCNDSSAEAFRFEPVASPARGFKVHPADDADLCAGVSGDSTDEWAPVRLFDCDPASPAQVFLLDAVG
jgi:hypothetical protein